jgi:hypothetical protein
MISLLILAAAIGCFVLSARALGDKSIPLSKDQRLTGKPAVVIGIVLLVAGVFFSILLLAVLFGFGGRL